MYMMCMYIVRIRIHSPYWYSLHEPIASLPVYIMYMQYMYPSACIRTHTVHVVLQPMHVVQAAGALAQAQVVHGKRSMPHHLFTGYWQLLVIGAHWPTPAAASCQMQLAHRVPWAHHQVRHPNVGDSWLGRRRGRATQRPNCTRPPRPADCGDPTLRGRHHGSV